MVRVSFRLLLLKQQNSKIRMQKQLRTTQNGLVLIWLRDLTKKLKMYESFLMTKLLIL